MSILQSLPDTELEKLLPFITTSDLRSLPNGLLLELVQRQSANGETQPSAKVPKEKVSKRGPGARAENTARVLQLLHKHAGATKISEASGLSVQAVRAALKQLKKEKKAFVHGEKRWQRWGTSKDKAKEACEVARGN